MNAMRLTSSAPSLRQHTINAPAPTWRRPGHVVLETCVEDVEGVRISARAGADRAELADNLTAAEVHLTEDEVAAITATPQSSYYEVSEEPPAFVLVTNDYSQQH
mgnify:CR=1 FL=1